MINQRDCNKPNTSFGEQMIYYYLRDIGINRYKYDNYEIDIYLPNYNIGIEFNGSYWHNWDKPSDQEKEQYLKDKIILYYICEGKDNKIINDINGRPYKIYFNKNNYNQNLEWAINMLFNFLTIYNEVDIDVIVDVNIEIDKQYVYKQSSRSSYKNSLAIKYPAFLLEWDYNKNLLTPYEVTGKSNKRVWWKCAKGHSYQMTVAHKTNTKSTCPICRKIKKIKSL